MFPSPFDARGRRRVEARERKRERRKDARNEESAWSQSMIMFLTFAVKPLHPCFHGSPYGVPSTSVPLFIEAYYFIATGLWMHSAHAVIRQRRGIFSNRRAGQPRAEIVVANEITARIKRWNGSGERFQLLYPVTRAHVLYLECFFLLCVKLTIVTFHENCKICISECPFKFSLCHLFKIIDSRCLLARVFFEKNSSEYLQNIRNIIRSVIWCPNGTERNNLTSFMFHN